MQHEKHSQMGHQEISAEMRHCIDECQSCHAVCLETTMYCLQMGGEHADPTHVRLLMDCAEICQTSANFMLRSSNLHAKVCGLCAEICELCAQDCDRFPEDSTMQRCAESCRSCASSCRQMASAAG